MVLAWWLNTLTPGVDGGVGRLQRRFEGSCQCAALLGSLRHSVQGSMDINGNISSTRMALHSTRRTGF